MHPTEHSEQAGLVCWFRSTFPGVLIFAIPNGGKRSINLAKRLKAEGVVPGVPDLFIPAWTLWIEMKRSKGGRLSGHQKNIKMYLESCGHNYIVGHGAADASRQILDFTQKKTGTSPA